MDYMCIHNQYQITPCIWQTQTRQRKMPSRKCGVNFHLNNSSTHLVHWTHMTPQAHHKPNQWQINQRHQQPILPLVLTDFPVFASQSLTDLSKEALAMSLASGEKLTSMISCWCPKKNKQHITDISHCMYTRSRHANVHKRSWGGGYLGYYNTSFTCVEFHLFLGHKWDRKPAVRAIIQDYNTDQSCVPLVSCRVLDPTEREWSHLNRSQDALNQTPSGQNTSPVPFPSSRLLPHTCT